MRKLPERIQKAVNRYRPVSVEGIVFYPVLMEEWDEFAKTLPVLDFLPQSLPVALAKMPLLEAFHAIEMTNRWLKEKEPEKITEPIFEPLTLASLLLILALRLGQGEKAEARLERCMIDYTGDRFNGLVLRGNDGEAIDITPRLFQRLRPILAAQNGVELESEDANPEIVKAEQQIAAQRAPKLKPDPVSRISWVAYKCGIDEDEIYSWPIAKFTRRERVIRVDENYLACQIGQMSGMVDWKKSGGPPFPHPYLERDQELLASVEIGSIGGGAAKKAMDAALAQTNSNKKE